jgi:C4-dicarboxylate-specific signal transduction histidine kinase
MKQELNTQYLQLSLIVSLMVTRLQENAGKISELEEANKSLEQKLETKTQELQTALSQVKELEKSFKKSDKIGKLVVNTEDTEAAKAELKKKLDEYIVSIDHCIEQLRKP